MTTSMKNQYNVLHEEETRLPNQDSQNIDNDFNNYVKDMYLQMADFFENAGCGCKFTVDDMAKRVGNKFNIPLEQARQKMEKYLEKEFGEMWEEDLDELYHIKEYPIEWCITTDPNRFLFEPYEGESEDIPISNFNFTKESVSIKNLKKAFIEAVLEHVFVKSKSIREK